MNSILDEVIFWESQFPNYPFIWKVKKIMEGSGCDEDSASSVLSEYQKSQEI